MTVGNGHDDFEQRLGRGGRLLPELEVDVDGPDVETDRRVLARARAALAERPRGTPAPRSAHASRWAVPLALAATLVLSFALVLQRDGRDAVAPSAADPTESAVDSLSVATSATETAASPPIARSTPVGPGQTDAPSAARSAAGPPAPVVAAAAAEPQATARAASSVGMTVESARDAVNGEETPMAWIARIERLQAAGEFEAARRELAAFRERYPRVPLPEGMRALGDR
jgi:hypothetical protein